MTKLRFERYDHRNLIAEGFPLDKSENTACMIDDYLHLWMIIDEGQVIAVFGYRWIREGVGEAIILLHPLGKNYIALPRTVKSAFKHICISEHLYRVTAAVDAEDDTAQRFTEYIGFHYEGYMRQGGLHREDMIAYAWVGEDTWL